LSTMMLFKMGWVKMSFLTGIPTSVALVLYMGYLHT
jgi:hypothetical protein